MRTGIIEVVRGNITTIRVDAIVNAANSSLMGGGGVDGAIHRAGGPEILDECRKIVSRQGGCKPGEAVITTAGKLPARYVIHTVGPVWNGGSHNEAQTLASCYKRSLELAVQHNCKTIAFPGISTGVYGYPKQLAAEVAIAAIRKFLQENDSIEKICLVSFDEESESIVNSVLATAS